MGPTRRDWCVRHNFQWGTNCCIKGFWFGGLDHGCIKGEVVVIAPDTCPTCDGKGTYEAHRGDAFQSELYEVECTNCDGSGWVWPDELVDRVADEMKAQFDSGAYGEIPTYKWRVLASAVVNALRRH